MKPYKTKILHIKSLPLNINSFHLTGIVLNGSCKLIRFNKELFLNKQDVFFINPEEVYAISGECIIAFIEINDNNLKNIELIDCLDSMDLKKDVSNTYRDCIFIKNLLTLFKNDEHYIEVISALLQDYSLMNNYHHHLLPLTNRQKMMYLEVVDTVLNNYKNHLSLSDIALKLNIQKNRLSVLFKEITGMTVLDYINLIRLKKAQTLLLIDKVNNEEIIRECGFSDRKYFYRYFLNTFKDTPKDYQEKMQIYNLSDYKIIGSKGSFYLEQMKEELDSLNTDTYFYRQYLFLQLLEAQNELKNFTLQLDLLNNGNYLYIENDVVNSWYGFDLLNSFVLKYQLSVELNFIIDKNTDYRKIDEVINLLYRSSQSLDARIIKNWKFIITIKQPSSLVYVDYISSSLQSLFKGNCITLKNTL